MALDDYMMLSIPSMPSIALTEVMEEAETKENFDSMEHVEMELKRLQQIYQNLNWFTAHRTSQTSLIEAELADTLETIAEKTAHLESLVQQYRQTRKNLYKLSLFVDIERHLAHHERTLESEHEHQYNRMRRKIQELIATRPLRQARLREQKADKNNLKSERIKLSPLRKNLEWTRELEKEARTIVRQQGKDVVAVHRTLHEAELNRLVLKKWIQKVLGKRKAWERQTKKYDEQFKAKVKYLEPVVKDETNRVESSIACYETNINLLKQKVIISRNLPRTDHSR